MLNFQEKFLADQETYMMDAKAEERAKWQGVLAAERIEKEAERAEKEAALARIAELESRLASAG